MRSDRLRQLLDTAERHTRAGRWSRAVFFYRKVLAHSREGEFECELAHSRLGDLHLGLGQAAQAVPHLSRARALAEDEPEYALMLGRALRAADRPDEASNHLLDAVASPTHAADALAELAHAASDRGDRALARRLATHAAERHPNDCRFQHLSRSFADA
ncbi:MAG: hypothetical protein KC620_08680 [Myxococcales bacterium]|nr:hypothetical protein [Myxococcales bacterium]